MSLPPASPSPRHLNAVLEGLAVNPCLARPLLMRLLVHRPVIRHIARGRRDLTPALVDRLLEADGALAAVPLACNPSLPTPFRIQLADHPEPWVRTALLNHEHTSPVGLFERYADDPSPQVREAVAENDHTPADIRARLVDDPEPAVRAVLAQWWTTAPEPVRRGLLTDPDLKVRAAACSTYYRRLPHPVPPADLRPALLADPATRAGVIRHLDLDPATAADLAGDPDEKVRKEAAAHPGLPAHLRDVLADDPDAMVRAAVFARSDTSEVQRASIHAGLVAGSERFDLDLPAADDADLDCYLALLSVQSRILPWVIADPLPHLDSPYPAFRRSAAASDALSAAERARLLHDESQQVRETAAAHTPDLSPDDAERLERLHHPNSKSPGRPADLVAFPTTMLRRFATDPDPRIRALAARDHALPGELAQHLAGDEDPAVRLSIADHPQLPTPAVIALISDPDAQVAKAAAQSPLLPKETMGQLLDLAGL